MAIAIPEAAEAVSAGQGALAARGSAAAARPRTIRAERATYTSRTEPPRGRQGGSRRVPVQPAVQIGSRRRAARRGRGRPGARLPGSHSYQPVILAEFVVAIVVVSVSPLAKGGTSEAQAKGSPSPYSVNTLKQLVAIGGVYFVLALLASSHRAGRFAAWFGGLVLLGLGLAEYLSGDLPAFFGIFGPSATAPGAGQPITSGIDAGTGLGQGFVPNPNAASIFPTVTPQGVTPAGQQNITFSQPGVATTTETTPGVTVT